MHEIYWFHGQKKIIFKLRLKTAITFLLIGLFIGTAWGMYWRHKQVDPSHKAQVQKLEAQVEHFKNHWTPIRGKEVKRAREEKK